MPVTQPVPLYNAKREEEEEEERGVVINNRAKARCFSDANGGGWLVASSIFFVFVFVWNIGKSGSEKRKMAESGREELWVTPSEWRREERGERTLKEENASQPTKWRRATHSKKAWPIDPALFLFFFFFFFFGVLSWAHETHSTHCHGRHPPSPPSLLCMRQSLRVRRRQVLMARKKKKKKKSFVPLLLLHPLLSTGVLRHKNPATLLQ